MRAIVVRPDLQIASARGPVPPPAQEVPAAGAHAKFPLRSLAADDVDGGHDEPHISLVNVSLKGKRVSRTCLDVRTETAVSHLPVIVVRARRDERGCAIE